MTDRIVSILRNNKSNLSAALSADHDTLESRLKRYWHHSHSYTMHQRLQKRTISSHLRRYLPETLEPLDKDEGYRALSRLHYDLMDESDTVETRHWEEIDVLTRKMREDTGREVRWHECICGTLDRPRIDMASNDFPLTLSQISADYRKRSSTIFKTQPSCAVIPKPRIKRDSPDHSHASSWSNIARAKQDEWAASVFRIKANDLLIRRPIRNRWTDPEQSWSIKQKCPGVADIWSPGYPDIGLFTSSLTEDPEPMSSSVELSPMGDSAGSSVVVKLPSRPTARTTSLPTGPVRIIPALPAWHLLQKAAKGSEVSPNNSASNIRIGDESVSLNSASDRFTSSAPKVQDLLPSVPKFPPCTKGEQISMRLDSHRSGQTGDDGTTDTRAGRQQGEARRSKRYRPHRRPKRHSTVCLPGTETAWWPYP